MKYREWQKLTPEQKQAVFTAYKKEWLATRNSYPLSKKTNHQISSLATPIRVTPLYHVLPVIVKEQQNANN